MRHKRLFLLLFLFCAYSSSHAIVIGKDSLWAEFHGWMSTINAPQLSVSGTYLCPTKQPLTLKAEVQLGLTYNTLNGTLLYAPKEWFALQVDALWQQWFYLEGDHLVWLRRLVPSYSQREAYGRIAAVFPLAIKGKFEVGVLGGYRNDGYSIMGDTKFSGTFPDHTKYKVADIFGGFSGNTLDQEMFPTEGHRWQASLHAYFASESAKSANYADYQEFSNKNSWWFAAFNQYERYFRLTPHLRLGLQAEAMFFFKKLPLNYAAAVLQAPHFAPTPHSKLIFNPHFSANHYLAAGIKPIICFSPRLQWRMEGYVFAPIYTINRYDTDADILREAGLPVTPNTAFYSPMFSDVYFLTETTVCYQWRDKLTISGYVNWYSTPSKNWNVGISLGVLFFHPRMMQ